MRVNYAFARYPPPWIWNIIFLYQPGSSISRSTCHAHLLHKRLLTYMLIEPTCTVIRTIFLWYGPRLSNTKNFRRVFTAYFRNRLQNYPSIIYNNLIIYVYFFFFLIRRPHEFRTISQTRDERPFVVCCTHTRRFTRVSSVCNITTLNVFGWRPKSPIKNKLDPCHIGAAHIIHFFFDYFFFIFPFVAYIYVYPQL